MQFPRVYIQKYVVKNNIDFFLFLISYSFTWQNKQTNKNRAGEFKITY